MSFNSYIFILGFLPVVLIVYYLAWKKSESLSKLVLTIASVFFIAWGNPLYLVFFAIYILVNFVLAKRVKDNKYILTIGVVLDVLCLGFYKYTGFITGGRISMTNILVPLGISFVTFTQIAFLVDCYKGKIEDFNLLDFSFFTLYFPKLVQGPIVKYSEIKQKKPTSDNFALGLWFLTAGLGKKVLLADNLAVVANYGYSFSGNFGELTNLEAMLTILCYTLQIYFDFSGYSQMAVGVSAMLGIDLKDNFDRPYISVSVDDFWKRWHISLTDFLREYIYFSLGGSRKGAIRAYINVMAIFLISGIWHGAAYTFIVWGAIHGVAMCINRFLDRHSKINPNIVTKIIGWILTFIYVNITWVFFRANSLKDANAIIIRAFNGRDYSLSEGFINQFATTNLSYWEKKLPAMENLMTKIPTFNVLLIIAVSMLIALIGKDRAKDFKPGIIKALSVGIIMLLCLISFSGVSQFIYGAF